MTADRVARAGAATATVALGLLVAAAALLFVPGAADVFMLPKWVAAWVCVAVALVALAVAAAAAGRPLPFARSGVALGVVALVATVAAGVSHSRGVALLGLHERYGGAVSWLLWLGLFVAVVGVGAGAPGRLVTLAWTLSGSAALCALYGVLQRHGIDRYRFLEQSGASTRFPGASLGNSNFLGGFLAVAIPVTLALGLMGRRSRRAPALTAGALGLLAAQLWGLWEAQSRGGMLAALLGGGVVLLVAGRSLAARRGVTLLGAFAVVAALGGIAVATVVIASPSVDGLPGAAGRSGLGRSESTAVRGYEWQAALGALADRPLLGSGPDTFLYEYPRQRSRDAGAATGSVLSDEPHNVLLEQAVDTGLLGVAAFLGFLALAVAPSVRRARRAGSSGPPTDGLRAAALGGAAAFVAQGWFSIAVVPLVAVGMLMLGVLAALDDPWVVRGVAQPRRLGRSGRRLTAAGAGVMAAVLVVVGLAGGRALRASGQANLGAVRAAAGDGSGAEAAFAAALRTWPFDTATARLAGAAAEAAAAGAATRAGLAAALRRADRHYSAGLRRQPRASALLVDRARIATYRARLLTPRAYPDAARAWARAASADPNNWQVRFLWAVTLNDWADARRGDDGLRRRATAQWERSVRIKPDDAAGWINLVRVYGALGDTAAQRDAVRRAAAALGVDPAAFAA